MDQQSFEQSVENGNPLRAQRMTPAEARAVIGLWQQERIEEVGLTDRPAVPDVAEGLDISVEDVQRLLLEVRRQRVELQRSLVSRRRPEPLPRLRQAAPLSEWVEVRPGVWEDARVPSYSYVDFDLLAPNKEDSSQLVRSRSVRVAAALGKAVWFTTFGLALTPVAYLIYLTVSQSLH